MKRIIVVDTREDFLADINTRMILDDERELTVVTTLTSPEHLHIALKRYSADIVAVSENVLGMQEEWDFEGVTLVGYALTSEGTAKFEEKGMLCYGIIRKVSLLLDRLEQGLPKPTVSEKGKEIVPEPAAEKEEQGIEIKTEEKSVPEKEKDKEPDVSNRNIRSQLNLYRSTQEQEATRKVELEFKTPQKKTKVVTVYSAKGGVGKTTLSTEIAAYLALTSGGRERYKVCLVDYNIDFGDVLPTLDLSADKPNMSAWAADIQRRLAAGEWKDEMLYSPGEYSRYLQKHEKTEMCVLTAPVSHEESYAISEEALQIMLNSLVCSCEFDFVICDTGNNTRDGAVVALEAADYVLLVCTQDVTAANCNDTFLTTMKRLHFNTSKIRLVINNIRPSKATGVSVSEIEELFPYTCIARIRHDTDVIRANNYSRPIVYKPEHEVTKEIQKIIAFLTGNDSVEPPRKQGFFSRLFRR